MVLTVLILLVAFVLWIIFYTNKEDVERDIIDEVSKEDIEYREDMMGTFKEIIGTDYKILSWIEMDEVVKKIKRDAEERGEELEEDDIADILGKEYGILNRVAYEHDLIINENEYEDMYGGIANLLVRRAAVSIFDKPYLNIEDFKKLRIVPTNTMFLYENSLEGKESKYDYLPVLTEMGNSFDGMLVSDTNGFVKGDTVDIGYPVIDRSPIIKGLFGNDKDYLLVKFDVYLTEDEKLGDVLDKVSKLDVEINGTKAKPLGELKRDEILDDIVKQTGVLNEDGGKVFIDGVKFERDFDVMSEPFVYLSTVYQYDIDKEIDDFTESDLKGYQKFIKEIINDNYLLGGTKVKVMYIIDYDVVMGDYNVEEDLIHYFLTEGHEPPIVTIDGKDFKFSVVTEKLGKNLKYKLD